MPLPSATPNRVAYFLSHPVQYQSPLLRRLALEGLPITTVYGETETAGLYYNADYGQTISWDQPLLEGYPHDVLKRPRFPGGTWLGWKQSAGAWLDEHRPDAVWVHGWGTAFSIGCLWAARERGLPILLRGETHLKSRLGSRLWRYIHHEILSRVFKQVDQMLAIGTANRELYLYYGVSPEKITIVPYVTDNEAFQTACKEASAKRGQLRSELDLVAGRPVLLYVGRLSREKSVETLLNAWAKVCQSLPGSMRPYLLVAGNGPLADKLKSHAERHLPEDVRFLGFVPPSRLPALYDLCDVFVLPSSFEPWGMVVNEAMNAARPVVLSDAIGAGTDLLRDGWNGFRFRTGDASDLAHVLTKLLSDRTLLHYAGIHSLERIGEWGLDEAVIGVKTALARLPQRMPIREEETPASQERHGIEVAYAGVHEIFQLAIAAEEMKELRTLQCSFFGAPGMWGHAASRVTYIPSAFPLGSELLPAARVREIPFPALARQIAQRISSPKKQFDPLPYHQWFERRAAAHIAGSDAVIAVAAETCALGFFEVAKQRGMRCVLDSHGIPAPFLDRAVRKAADEFGLPCPAPCDTPQMARHKERERELADVILFCSELQKNIWVDLGVSSSKSQAVTLWVDSDFWKPGAARPTSHQPVQVVAVGAGTLAKGLPYLLDAVDQCEGAVELTLVGKISKPMMPFIKRAKRPPRKLPYMSRPELRDFYSTQHLLVMPSLGDSFGFVAMEAMACGLPVIVTDHCGVPVPDASWRVPAHSAQAFAEKLSRYVTNTALIVEDSIKAVGFAALYPPSEYRRKVRQIYAELLAQDPSPHKFEREPISQSAF